jgi:hypothetical protein
MSSTVHTSTPMSPTPAPPAPAEVTPVAPRTSTPVEPASAQGLVVPPPPTLPTFAGPARTVEVAAAVNTLNAILDSFGSILLAQQQLRTEGVERGTQSAEAGEANADNALERQREALEATERAQRRANGLLGRAPRWVKKLVAGLITVAGAVAGAFTGGVAAGLAIAGAVLILAGDAVSKLLVKAGVDPDKAMWVGFAVKIVGTALSLGAGAAGGAASAAGTASQAVRTATQVIDTATKVATTLSAGAQLGLDATAAAFNYQADRASANADEAGLELDVAHDQQEDGIAVLRDAHTDYQRVVTRMQTWLTTQQQTTSAMVAHLSA